ncbi:YegP family protein [Nocardioides sp.]|uniref:YegP family protein n=1 Tax=Nocardioides sp. TaxID=35761 RepID=UPI0037843AA8
MPAALSSFLAAGAFPLGQASDSWVVTTGMLKIVAVFEVDGQVGDHRWQLLNWDGEVLAEKGGYLTRAAALQDIERIRVAAVTANVVES